MIRPGVVIYTLDVARLSRFYAEVAELTITGRSERFALVESDLLELAVVAIPDELAVGIRLDDPPVRREDAAIKPAFPVSSLAAARAAAGRLGGVVDDEGSEWTFRGARVCDGHDPEGNVFQLRVADPLGEDDG